MENYYSILGIYPSASKEDIDIQFNQLSKNQKHIGDNDYDSFNELLRVKQVIEAYETLSNTYRRLVYDISTFGVVEYVGGNFENEAELNKYISAIVESANSRLSTIKNRDKLIDTLEKDKQLLVDKLLQNEIDYKVSIEIEKNRGADLEEVISDLLGQIDSMKQNITLLNDLKEEKENIEKRMQIIEQQNEALLVFARKYRINLFKTITISFFAALFVALLIFYNL